LSIRLNKLLAQRGIGARRKCDTLIQEGAVRVNGRVVLEPGTQVEPERDRVLVRGRPLPPPAALRYYVLHKPVGVISTLSDPEQRRTVAHFLPPGARVFPVGRLDADTSGLLILTNDGELAHHLMHPRYGVEKVYRVRLARTPTGHALERLRRGVEFEPGVVSAPCRVRALASSGDHAIIEIAIHEGRYRQVRRMCEALGLSVQALHRSAYGPLRLGPIERGMWRELSADEVRRLRESAARPQARGRGGPPRSRREHPRREGAEHESSARPERAEARGGHGAGEPRVATRRPTDRRAPRGGRDRLPGGERGARPRGAASAPSDRGAARVTRDRSPGGKRGFRPRGEASAPSDRGAARVTRDRSPNGKRAFRPRGEASAPADRRAERNTRGRSPSGESWIGFRGQPGATPDRPAAPNQRDRSSSGERRTRSQTRPGAASEQQPRNPRDRSSTREGWPPREATTRGRAPRRGKGSPEPGHTRAGRGPVRSSDRPRGRDFQRTGERPRGAAARPRGRDASGEKARRPAGPRSGGTFPKPRKRRRAF
jgi:23S rRNA pseudouridine2605 synthase